MMLQLPLVDREACDRSVVDLQQEQANQHQANRSDRRVVSACEARTEERSSAQERREQSR